MQPRSTFIDGHISILHLEDSTADHQLIVQALKRSGLDFSIQRVETLGAFQAAIDVTAFDIILADYRLPGFNAEDAWRLLQASDHKIPFVLLSGAIGETAAVAAIHQGMSDYVRKDDLSSLPRVIRRAIEVDVAQKAREKAQAELAASERRLSAFAEHLQSAIEQERAAIAREIHDDIGGSLAAVKLDLGWLRRHILDNAAQSHIQAANDMLQHALGASQRIMLNLRPSILDQGLVAAVQWLGRDFEARTGITVSIRTDEAFPPLPKPIELVAYRTAQEALTNIGKHAQCSQVRIEVSAGEGALTLEVDDNGRGISEADRTKRQSFGLNGLQERARIAGGWLDISSQVGKGTSIILTIPMDAQSAIDTELST